MRALGVQQEDGTLGCSLSLTLWVGCGEEKVSPWLPTLVCPTPLAWARLSVKALRNFQSHSRPLGHQISGVGCRSGVPRVTVAILPHPGAEPSS